MREIVAQLHSALWGAWRFRWVGLVLVWLIAMGGWLAVSLTPEKYIATARIHVDTNSVLRPLLRGLAIQPDVDQRIALMSRTLLSRPNLEKLMRMADLDLYVKNDGEKEELLDNLRRSISLAGERRNASLYSISFKHEDRNTAKKVVQSLITVFVESALGDKRKDSSGAQEFLDKQIADYEQRLIEAEARLADFKQRNVGVLPGETGGYYKRLEIERGQLEAASLQLRETRNRKAELVRQIDGEEPVFLAGQADDSPEVLAIDERISALEQQLDTLALKYTDRHPNVLQVKEVIASLEAKKGSAIARAESNLPEQFSGLLNSPVYQQMRTMLAQTEATEAELKTRVDEYARRVKSLEEKVDNIPLIESELQQLNRDYDVISAQHNTLLQRRESARISDNVEQQANDVKFRVIDPPFVPLEPNEPNKLLLNAVVFILALGAGAGLAFVISLFKPVFITRESLTQVTGLPVLGAVAEIKTSSDKRRSLLNNVLFFSVFSCLILVFVGVSVLDAQTSGVSSLLQAIRGGA